MKKEYPEEYSVYVDRKDVVCNICGEAFKTTHSGKKVCSDKCKKERDKIKSLEKKELTDFIIFERDNFRCVYCGKSSIEDSIKLEVEHIYPVRKDGDSELYNIVTACELCNRQKHTNVMKEENILRLWDETNKRNEVGGIEHFTKLKYKLEQTLRNRRERLIQLKKV